MNADADDGSSGREGFSHEPVLVAPILQLLDPQPNQVIFDGTTGMGGHAAALIPRIAPRGVYVGTDLDENMLAAARQKLGDTGGVRLELHAMNFSAMPEALAKSGVEKVDLALVDLGVNSAQLDDATRGFSFDRDGPLDMRFNQTQKEQAVDLVNRLSESELADLFYELGQEHASRKIARKICQVRHNGRITTTRTLARAVESVFETGHARVVGKTHPATRVFQALRVAVNREFENLEKFLHVARDCVRVGGKLAVISFHSLEDGMAKRCFRAGGDTKAWKEITREPVIADEAERRRNPRSRSAKLRIAQRVEAAS